MHDFDVILGMDWLWGYHAKVDCYNKVASLLLSDGNFGQFFGIQNCFPYIISAIRVSQLLSKACQGYLAFIKEDIKEEKPLTNVHIMCEFSDELPGLPLDRE